ncbi:ScbA/BarX family gamma-butyrolactone biosynthesis protein [Streptomyces sp. NPDC047928]|uniref:ScbA/BarX family gamma-butyrolactone biosynthesis protein n=1 Tax=unclassified Streptomyces TaxID=2593676 RepID=UPI003713F871
MGEGRPTTSVLPTAPAAYLRRSDASDVLPTGWRRHDDTETTGAEAASTRFTVGVRWARDHRFYTPVHGRYAPSLIAESMRQAAKVLIHAEYGVPLDHPLLMWDLHYTAQPEGLLVQRTDLRLDLEVTCSRVQRRGARFAGMDVHVVFVRDGEPIAAGGGRLTCVSPTAYRRLRGDRAEATGDRALTIPVPPADVHRTGTADVLLSPTPNRRRWQLRADPGNSSLFHRPNDHIPGMVLLEAAYQAAYTVAAPERFYPTSVDISFSRYAEFDPPCWLEAHTMPTPLPGGIGVQIAGDQDANRVFLALLEGVAVD